MKITPLFVVTAAVVMMSCATAPEAPRPQVPDVVALDFEDRLIDTAEDIRQSLRVLAETRNAEALRGLTPEARRQVEFQVDRIPEGLDVPLTLASWRGGIEPALTMIAQATGYGLSVVGDRPAKEMTVYLDGDRREAYDMLRDLGAQLGVSADVCVVPHKRNITLSYSVGCDALISRTLPPAAL